MSEISCQEISLICKRYLYKEIYIISIYSRLDGGGLGVEINF